MIRRLRLWWSRRRRDRTARAANPYKSTGTFRLVDPATADPVVDAARVGAFFTAVRATSMRALDEPGVFQAAVPIGRRTGLYSTIVDGIERAGVRAFILD